MRTEEKISRIATACGWTHLEELPPEWLKDTRITGVTPEGSHRAYVPDYFDDLNACHEMEKAVPVELMGAMAANLCRVVGFPGVNNTGKFLPREAYMWHATAAQRAEAFGKTINLW